MVEQGTLNPLIRVRFPGGVPNEGDVALTARSDGDRVLGRLRKMVLWTSWLSRRSAKPIIAGSNPARTSRIRGARRERNQVSKTCD